MTLTAEAVWEAIRTFCPEYEWEAWDEFHWNLTRKEAVKLPGVGWAYLMESNQDQFGCDQYQGQFYTVFKVNNSDGEEKYFRRFGSYHSFVGYEYDGPVHEVTGRLVPRYVWEAVE